VRIPPSLIARQSESTLHCTHVPARFGLVVSPHTRLGGLSSAVQIVPVAAGVKLGVPATQAGTVSQTVLGVGRLLSSPMNVTLPLPLHTTSWHVPGTWKDGGATVLPG